MLEVLIPGWMVRRREDSDSRNYEGGRGAQERARELDAALSQSLANVPQGVSATAPAPPTRKAIVANVTAGTEANKENVKPKRQTKQRFKIVPPPFFDTSGNSEVASLASSKGPVRPVRSWLATRLPVKAGSTTTLSGGAAAVMTNAQRAKIKTVSLPLEEIPTRPATGVQGTTLTSVVQSVRVTFTQQTYTPQSSRRDSVFFAVARQQWSRRGSVLAQHIGMGGRREEGHGGQVTVVGLS
ncbi:hypothetical protein BKA70DRAFT_1222724 [Coprinopsis sp. MPI-PUGE-AT-0042]|nr:hypothetical protein BKA70DRAFT_1222724 [Coprinopsis sp. MPI-PUGE-AT-0042]